MLGIMARYEKAVLFLGEGRAGKGTLLKVLEALVPPAARCAVSPFRWNGEYYLAGLAGKRLNVVGELPEEQPIPAADFKTVIGRDSLTGRHPTHRPFSFRNQAAHIFNSNHLVNTRDRSEAFFARWIVLDFPNSRIGSTIDVDLAERIVEQEIGAIAAWALEGARRLVTRGYFTSTSAHERLVARWRRRSDSVMEFVHDDDVCALGAHGGGGVRRADFYYRYVDWCRSAGRHALGKQKVFDALESPAASALGIEVARNSEDGWIVKGLRFAFPDL